MSRNLPSATPAPGVFSSPPMGENLSPVTVQGERNLAALVFRVIGMVLLTGSVLMATDLALIWALTGYLHMGTIGYAFFGSLLGLPGLYLFWKLVVMAVKAERDMDEHQDDAEEASA